MVLSTKLTQALNKAMDQAGTQIRIRYFSQTIGSVWDDELILTLSGNSIWTSGLVMPIRGIDGSSEAVLLAQGKLTNSDKKLFLNGSLMIVGSILNVDIQLGSPNGELYSAIPDGAELWQSDGVSVYKKQYIRRLTGSLT